jgi:hypothetical protein
MGLPQRQHFPIDEVAAAWGASPSILLAYGIEEKLAICVLAFNWRVQICEQAAVADEPAVWLGATTIRGPHALFPEDLWSVNSRAVTRITKVRSAGSWYEFESGHIEVTRGDLVITAEERSRFEREHSVSGSPADTDAVQPFTHSRDYRDVSINGHTLRLSPLRAEVVRELHAAWQAGSAWIDGETLLLRAGSKGSRLVDVFAPVPDWRRLIISDRRGRWRLNLTDADLGVEQRRVFRRPMLRIVR